MPQELDNYTTILELDFSDEEMINFLIEFSETQGIKLDKNLAGKFISNLIRLFKHTWRIRKKTASSAFLSPVKSTGRLKIDYTKFC